MAQFIAPHPPRSNDLSRRSVLQGAVALGAVGQEGGTNAAPPAQQQSDKPAQ